MAAAAIIFFAFYGFDAIATAAEEAKNPSRDLAIGIVGSMLVCVIIYMAVGAAAIGAEHYQRFAKGADPLAQILRDIGWPQCPRNVGFHGRNGLGQPMPDPWVRFVVVGLTNGRQSDEDLAVVVLRLLSGDQGKLSGIGVVDAGHDFHVAGVARALHRLGTPGA